MASSPHFFIGIPVSNELKEEFVRWQGVLREDLADNYQTWTHKDDFHITLKFLGEADPGHVEDLKQSLKNMNPLERFELTAGQLGTFGRPKKPRVIYAGVEGHPLLNRLKEQIEKVGNTAGFLEDNQPYHPHVTLAKKWKGEKISKETLTSLAEKFDQQMKMEVNSFSLFRIHPSNQPKYEEIIKIELK